MIESDLVQIHDALAAVHRDLAQVLGDTPIVQRVEAIGRMVVDAHERVRPRCPQPPHDVEAVR